MLPQDPNGLHILHRLGHIPGGEAVLHFLVLTVAEARFLHSQLRQRPRLQIEGPCDRFHDGIQLLLGKGRKGLLGGLSLFRQRPCFLAGTQIFIQFH